MTEIQKSIKSLQLENLLLKARANAALGLLADRSRAAGWTRRETDNHIGKYVADHTEFLLESEPSIPAEEKERILNEIRKEQY